jgi:beta-phosphoglucomutase-like phosphatase (HAD superfamily)
MIWLDMDGVLADFDGHYQACFGVKPTRWPEPDTVDWKLIASVPDFYLNLPLMPGAKELFRFVDELGVGTGILTGVPKEIDESSNHKIEWAAKPEHFPHVMVRCCRSRNKFKHGKPGHVLVDDYLKYRDAWVDMGGIFVHHTSAESSIQQLRELRL